MDLTLFKRKAAVFAACISVFSALSCVQEEYEVSEENINMEVTVFQDGVTLPLGNTKAITLGEILEEYAPEIAEEYGREDGTYAFGMSETYPLSDQLDFLTESFSIDGFSVSEKIPFDLSDVNVSDVSIPEISVPYTKKLSEVIPSVDLKFSPTGLNGISKTADISSYVPEIQEIGVEDFFSEDELATLNPISIDLSNPLLAKYADMELPLFSDDPQEMTIESVLKAAGVSGFSVRMLDRIEVKENIQVPVSFVLPEMITDVNAVQFDENAKIRVTLDLSDNLFFTSGKIIPHIDLDIHEILHLTDEENSSHPLQIDHIIDDFILSEEGDNPYYASESYGVKGLAIEDGDFKKNQNGNLVYDKTISVVPVMSFGYEGLKTSLAKLSAHKGGTVTMAVSVEFIDFKIDNVEVAVEPVETVVSSEFDLSFTQSLPELVKGVQSVSFAEGSGVSLDIDVTNLSRIAGLDLAVGSIDLEFPDGIKVQGTDAQNMLSIPVGSLSDGRISRKVAVTGVEFDPSSQEPGKVSFDGKVKMNAKAVASVKDGRYINTKDLPSTPSQDITLSVTPAASFEVSDFKVDIDGCYYEVSENQSIEFEVPEEVAELGKVVIVPETEDGQVPVVTIDIELPETGIPIGPSGEKGLVVDFPDMVVFKDIPAEIQPYYSNGKLVFTDSFPSHIELPVDYIEAEAIKENDVYVIRDMFSVEGEVGVAPCVVVKADVDALTAPDAVVAFNAYVPKMVPSTVSIDMYEVEIPEKTIELGEEISLDSLPEELVEIGEILLKDVSLDIDVTAPGISALIKDADVDIELDVTLPDVIMLENPLEDGVLKIRGRLVGESVEIEPVKVLGLEINKTADELTEYLKTMKVTYSGDVTIRNASLDMDGLEDIELNVDISLMTAGTENKIDISKVTGKIDYAIEPITMEVDLEPLAEALDYEGVTASIDLNRFSLALELNTNLSIPVIVDLAITPYKGDVAGTPLTLPEPLRIEIPDASGEPVLVRYWVSNFESGDPYLPEGYQHIYLDLFKLLEDIPDRLELTLNAWTDKTSVAAVSPSEEGCVLDASYAFNLPFEFGDDMNLEFRHTLEDLPDELATVLQYSTFALRGEVESSLPIALEMTYNFLDSAGNKVDMVENAGRQTISSGTISGGSVKTDLDIKAGIKSGARSSEVDAIELVFKAKGLSGAPLRRDNFIKATLQAAIPEGVTVDLKDFMGNE